MNKKQYQQKYYLLHKERCKESIKRFNQKRRYILNQLKNKPCFDCQGWFEPCQMDWDHLDPNTKLFSVNKSMTRPLKETLEEIKKCQLVCSNCHRLRTWKRHRLQILETI